MFWKSKNNTPKNIINNVSVEIDYDKLADKITQSILKANKEIEFENQKSSRILTSGIAISIMVLFLVLAALSVVGLYFVAKYMIVTDWSLVTDKSYQIFLCIMLCIILFFITIILVASGLEIYREKDRNFIMSAFSGVVGFIALIVSLIVGVM